MANAIKLLETITSYPVFEEDQVLTSKQLNDIVGYLDSQYRLSRVKMLGVGILWGLGITYSIEDIGIGKGCAVSTDGDLLHIDEDRTYRYYKEYKDEKAGYEYFFDKEKKQIQLFELLTDKEPRAKEVKTLKMSDMAALLYLESYEYDPDICTGNDCDNKGRTQINNLRVLLVKKADLGSLTRYSTEAHSMHSALEEMHCKRVKLNSGNVNNFNELFALYKTVLKENFDHIVPILKSSYTACEAFLGDIYPQSPLPVWNRKISEVNKAVKNRILFFQYIHDFQKDIVAAYREFKESMRDGNVLCSPDVKLFPKHILLGDIVYDKTSLDIPNRQLFIKSPALSSDPESTRKALFLHKRLDHLISNFRTDLVPHDRPEDIRITPSKTCEHRLGDRAIPYYYSVGTDKPIHETWNYDLHVTGKSNTICSYHAKDYGGTDQARNPFDYCCTCCSFYLIEGHIGMNFEEAEKRLRSLFAEFNIPVNILTLQIENDIKLLPIRPIFWHRDLKDMHYLHRRIIRQKLDNLEDFSVQLNDNIQKSKELPPEDEDDARPPIKAIARDNTNILKTQLKTVRANLLKPLVKFRHDEFTRDYTSAIQTTAMLNKRVKGVVYKSAFTPFEHFINIPDFSLLNWIEEIRKRREKKAKELSLFAKFLLDNPGACHLGGSICGGTFILAYSSSTKRVVADFSLPYWYHYDVLKHEDEEEEEEEEGEGRTIPKWIPPKWTLLNDVKVRLIKDKVLHGKILDIRKELNDSIIDHNAKLTKRIESTDSLLKNKIDLHNNYLTKQMADYKVVLSKKIEDDRKDLSGRINEHKTELSKKIDKQVETISKTYVGNLSSVFDSFLKAKTVPKMPVKVTGAAGPEGIIFSTPVYARAYEEMKSVEILSKSLDEKIKQGTASNAEKQTRAHLDAMMAATIAKTVTGISRKAGDVEEDSEEARFIALTTKKAKLIKDANAKRTLKGNIDFMKTSPPVRGKAKFGILLKDFKL